MKTDRVTVMVTGKVSAYPLLAFVEVVRSNLNLLGTPQHKEGPIFPKPSPGRTFGRHHHMCGIFGVSYRRMYPRWAAVKIGKLVPQVRLNERHLVDRSDTSAHPICKWTHRMTNYGAK
jgi:hypothetical protein